MAEDFGVQGRGAFYDQTGAIRDVVQNHLFQVLANLAMEPPARTDSESMRDEKVKVLKSIPPLTAEDVVRGQFRGYRSEPGVTPDSQVETFAAVRLDIQSWRWQGVPFYIRAGKSLPVTCTEVLVRLRRPPAIFPDCVPAPNYVRIRVSPEVTIALGATVMDEEEKGVGQPVELLASHHPAAGEMDAYERVLGDAMAGDSTLFAREDYVEEAWRIVDPVLKAGRADPRVRAGDLGPARGRRGDRASRRLEQPDRRRDAARERRVVTRGDERMPSDARRGGPPSAEHARIASAAPDRPGDWKAIGPYLSERAWGTVREDYSADGKAWEYFPHDHARSRAYRWNEDGLAGVCDLAQRMCLALAFWNGRDPFLKERIFGLTGPEGNHGEDAKEYWWYVDATPTASWLRWRYHYPQAEFPYARLREENARRGQGGPRVRARRHRRLRRRPLLADHRRLREGVAARPLPAHPRPQRRARGRRAPRAADAVVPQPLVVGGGAATAGDPRGCRTRAAWRARSPRRRASGAGGSSRAPTPRGARRRCSSARTRRTSRASSGSPRRRRIRRTASTTTWSAAPRPSIRRRRGHEDRRAGTASALRPGETVELRLRLARDDPDGRARPRRRLRRGRSPTASARPTSTTRSLRPAGTTDDEAAVMRQAFAGMVWSQQFYHYDVERWLDGDPASRRRPRRARSGATPAGVT